MEIEYWECGNCRHRIVAKQWTALEDRFGCPNCDCDMEMYYRPVYSGQFQVTTNKPPQRLY